jgi:hypothetical protein
VERTEGVGSTWGRGGCCLLRVKKWLQIGGSIELSVHLSHEDITVLAHPSMSYPHVRPPEGTGVGRAECFPSLPGIRSAGNNMTYLLSVLDF